MSDLKSQKAPEQLPSENMRRNVYFKYKGEFYYIGEITNRVNKLELLFKPSIKELLGGTLAAPATVDHFTYHASGQAHLKDKTDKYDIFNDKFQEKKFGDLQFVIFFSLIVEDISLLPKHTELLKNEIVFEVDNPAFQGIEVSLYDNLYLIGKEMKVDISNNELRPIKTVRVAFGEIGTDHENSTLVCMHVEAVKTDRMKGKGVVISQFFSESAKFKS